MRAKIFLESNPQGLNLTNPFSGLYLCGAVNHRRLYAALENIHRECPIERRTWALVIVKMHIRPDTLPCFHAAFIRFQIHIFVFQRAQKTLRKDVVYGAAFAAVKILHSCLKAPAECGWSRCFHPLNHCKDAINQIVLEY